MSWTGLEILRRRFLRCCITYSCGITEEMKFTDAVVYYAVREKYSEIVVARVRCWFVWKANISGDVDISSCGYSLGLEYPVDTGIVF